MNILVLLAQFFWIVSLLTGFLLAFYAICRYGIKDDPMDESLAYQAERDIAMEQRWREKNEKNEEISEGH